LVAVWGKKPKATWLEPVIEAEVAYSTVTENGLLREAVFKGLREDREVPTARSRAAGKAAGSRRRGARVTSCKLSPDAKGSTFGRV
jgi:bifunctional non-homologous end joining protein LigD